jgi:hypothetical protein
MRNELRFVQSFDGSAFAWGILNYADLRRIEMLPVSLAQTDCYALSILIKI